MELDLCLAVYGGHDEVPARKHSGVAFAVVFHPTGFVAQRAWLARSRNGAKTDGLDRTALAPNIQLPLALARPSRASDSLSAHRICALRRVTIGTGV